MSEQYDDLDAYIAKRAAKNPAPGPAPRLRRRVVIRQ